MKNKTKKIEKILNYIRTIRKQKGLTQEQVANVIGVERSTYVRKESGAIPITLAEFVELLEYLEIDYVVKSGDIDLFARLSKEHKKLVGLMDQVSKRDRTFIIESTKNFISHASKK